MVFHRKKWVKICEKGPKKRSQALIAPPSTTVVCIGLTVEGSVSIRMVSGGGNGRDSGIKLDVRT